MYFWYQLLKAEANFIKKSFFEESKVKKNFKISVKNTRIKPI